MAREKGMGNLQREKSGRWTARICVDGRRWSRSTRTKDLAKAEQFLQRMLAPLGRGEHALALADVWREYEKSPNRRDLAPSTMNAKRIVWMHFAAWMEANYPAITQLGQLTHDMVAEYLRVLRLHHTASTYNNRVCVIREICHVLADKAGLEEDAWKGVRLLADDSHTRRELTMEELRRLLEAARRYDGGVRGAPALPSPSTSPSTSPSPNFFTLFLIGIHTGLRLGDCCCLAWSEVNLERGIIQVLPRKVRKHLNGKPVTIPIHPELAEALQTECGVQSADGGVRRAEDPYVLPTLAGWYLGEERWRVGEGLSRIFKAAGIRTSIRIEGRCTATPDATFHSLRHTFVSCAANAGAPLAVVQSIVGHASSAMTRHYYHENEVELRRAIAAVPSVANGGRHTEAKAADGAISSPCDMKSESSPTISERLTLLGTLRDKALITAAEYDAQRMRILSEI